MFRKMLEDALGELLQDMAPTRPEIDPPSQRRRPDMTGAPDAEGVRRAVGEPSPRFDAPTVPAPRRVDLEGRNAPREVVLSEGRELTRRATNAEGRQAMREQALSEGLRPALRSNLRTTIEEGAPMKVERRQRSGIRQELSNPASIRNAFRVMEILGPPVALRNLPGNDRG